MGQIWNNVIGFFQNIFGEIGSGINSAIQFLIRFISRIHIQMPWDVIQYRFATYSWSDAGDSVFNVIGGGGALDTIFGIVLLILCLIGFFASAAEGGVIAGVIGVIIVLICVAIILAIVTTIVWLWCNLLQPIASTVLVLAAIFGLVIGVFVSIRNYIRSIREHADPWKDYVDRGRFVEENAARRSYFFGPGRHQAASIFKDAWLNNFESISDVVENRITADSGWAVKILLGLFVWGYLLFYIASVLTVGSILTLLIGLIHFAIMTVVMIVTWLIFSLVWLVDHIYLMLRRIKSVCPHCKETYRIPQFACPNCDRRHNKLVPSSYGIFHRKCVCGERLPTTFFNGRSRLKAYCPHCGEPLVSSDTRPFGITLVGASSAGKTAVLTSFFHQFQEDVDGRSELNCKVPEIQKAKFDQLNRFYTGAQYIGATIVDEATEMFSLILERPRSSERIQFSIFDVAGEVFETPDLSAIRYANDMAISQGIIFTLDPLSAPSLREEARTSDRAARQDMREVLNNFVNFLHTLSKAEKVGQKIRRPVAVLITKADSPAVAKYLDLEKVRSAVAAASNELETRDNLCRSFLKQIGMDDFLTALDAQFENAHFFLVSATGGVGRGLQFNPEEGLVDPFYWIISETDKGLADALKL